MKQEKIRKLIATQTEEITDAAKHIRHGFDKETIHQFRVEVKSLRSFLRLYWLYTGEAEPELPKRFKKLYRVSGAIRDLQLEIERIIDKKDVLKAYLDNIQLELEQRRNEWNALYTDKIMRKMSMRLTSHSYRSLPQFIPAEFMNDRLKAIDNLRQKGKLANEDLHTIRKLIKDMIYNLKIIKKNWKSAYKEIGDAPMEQLENFAKEIGTFNDDRLMQEHIQAFNATNAGRKEKSVLKSLKVDISKNIEHQKKRIIVDLSKLAGGAGLRS